MKKRKIIGKFGMDYIFIILIKSVVGLGSVVNGRKF